MFCTFHYLLWVIFGSLLYLLLSTNLFRLAHGNSLFVDNAARVLVLVGRWVNDFLVLRDLRGVRLQPPPPLPLPQHPACLILWLQYPPFPLRPVLVLRLNQSWIDEKMQEWKYTWPNLAETCKRSFAKKLGSFYLWRTVDDVAHDVNCLVMPHLGQNLIQIWILHDRV